MVRMDSFSSVPPHIQPPMAQVPSAIRELIKFVPLISIYSSMSFLVLSPRLVSPATERAWWDVMTAAQVFRFVELRLRFAYALPKGFHPGFGSDAYIAFIQIYAACRFPR